MIVAPGEKGSGPGAAAAVSHDARTAAAIATVLGKPFGRTAIIGGDVRSADAAVSSCCI